MKRFSLLSACLALPVSAVLAVSTPASAAETVVMTTGQTGEAMITFAFDKNAKPPKILIRTQKAGVAGSRLSIFVDSSKTATFRHIYTVEECRFPDGGASECMVTIPRSNPAYEAIVGIFKAGKEAHFVVEDGSVMAMDHKASLIGFTKSFDQ